MKLHWSPLPDHRCARRGWSAPCQSSQGGDVVRCKVCFWWREIEDCSRSKMLHSQVRGWLPVQSKGSRSWQENLCPVHRLRQQWGRGRGVSLPCLPRHAGSRRCWGCAGQDFIVQWWGEEGDAGRLPHWGGGEELGGFWWRVIAQSPHMDTTLLYSEVGYRLLWPMIGWTCDL